MSLKLGNSLCKHQSVIKVTQWNLKVISLHILLQKYLSMKFEYIFGCNMVCIDVQCPQISTPFCQPHVQIWLPPQDYLGLVSLFYSP